MSARKSSIYVRLPVAERIVQLGATYLLLAQLFILPLPPVSRSVYLWILDRTVLWWCLILAAYYVARRVGPVWWPASQTLRSEAVAIHRRVNDTCLVLCKPRYLGARVLRVHPGAPEARALDRATTAQAVLRLAFRAPTGSTAGLSGATMCVVVAAYYAMLPITYLPDRTVIALVAVIVIAALLRFCQYRRIEVDGEVLAVASRFRRTAWPLSEVVDVEMRGERLCVQLQRGSVVELGVVRSRWHPLHDWVENEALTGVRDRLEIELRRRKPA